ncbi:GntR family transcriptional regulator [Dongia sedimenti]|uniref:GntR family transcriptional regulator n=1 Tax=Dongia sedimenti TaxID=3064282 RepID=A0ABU0YNG1_9PROT|nr:GntR family transcriptional regulator [Rhodospirillaceae bacterium R-7]
MSESSVKRLPLRHQIKEAIIERIVAGKLRSGDRLVEMKIAAEFGTSQAPVREALRELEAIGFLSATPHRGAFVRDFWREGLKEFYAVRGALEESATRQAMPMQPADIEKLEAELEAMHAAALEQNLDGIARHSVAFHEIIVKAARNELLYTVWKSLCIETRTTVTLMAAGDNLLELADGHRAIIDTIKSGDVESACRAAREHQDVFEHLPVLEESDASPASSEQPAA